MKINKDLSKVMRVGNWINKQTKKNDFQFVWFALVFIAIFTIAILTSTIAHASDWSDNEIVSAIYKAEGGSRAKYLYGIRSISYSTPDEALKICRNTVRNNRRRFKEYGYKNFDNFISFLASRYCPIGAGNDPKGLNNNWERNVRYFLAKGESK